MTTDADANGIRCCMSCGRDTRGYHGQEEGEGATLGERLGMATYTITVRDGFVLVEVSGPRDLV